MDEVLALSNLERIRAWGTDADVFEVGADGTEPDGSWWVVLRAADLEVMVYQAVDDPRLEAVLALPMESDVATHPRVAEALLELEERRPALMWFRPVEGELEIRWRLWEDGLSRHALNVAVLELAMGHRVLTRVLEEIEAAATLSDLVRGLPPRRPAGPVEQPEPATEQAEPPALPVEVSEAPVASPEPAETPAEASEAPPEPAEAPAEAPEAPPEPAETPTDEAVGFAEALPSGAEVPAEPPAAGEVVGRASIRLDFGTDPGALQSAVLPPAPVEAVLPPPPSWRSADEPELPAFDPFADPDEPEPAGDSETIATHVVPPAAASMMRLRLQEVLETPPVPGRPPAGPSPAPPVSPPAPAPSRPVCPACSRENPPGSRFCGGCGTRIAPPD